MVDAETGFCPLLELALVFAVFGDLGQGATRLIEQIKKLFGALLMVFDDLISEALIPRLRSL